MKKSSIILAVLFAGVLVSCGNNGNTTSSVTPTTSNPPTSQTTSSATTTSELSTMSSPIFNKATTIYLAGDSTVKTYNDNQYIAGWGQYLDLFLDEDVKVVNAANGGRSSRSFINEGRLYDIEDSSFSYTFSQNEGNSIGDVIKEGDFLFIQFGHNDDASKLSNYSTIYDRMVPLGEKDANGIYPTTPATKSSTSSLPEAYTKVASDSEEAKALSEIKKYGSEYYAYDSGGTYKWYLKQYIDFARSHKATPVLITPVARVKFSNGEIIGGAGLHGENFAYVEAVRQLANEENCLLIDLFKASKEILETTTQTYANYMMALKPNELQGNWPAGYDEIYGNAELGYTGIEATHYNKYGAFLQAAKVAEEMLDNSKWEGEYFSFKDFINVEPKSYIDPSNLIGKSIVSSVENLFDSVNVTNPNRVYPDPNKVVEAITALGSVDSITNDNYLQHKEKVEAVKDLYSVLNIDDRSSVTNYGIIEEHENKIKEFEDANRVEPIKVETYLFDDLDTGSFETNIEIDTYTIYAASGKNIEVKQGKASATFRGEVVETTSYVSLRGSAKFGQYRYIGFEVEGACTISVMCRSSGDSARTLNLVDSTYSSVGSFNADAVATFTSVDVDAAGTYYIGSAGSGIYVYTIIVEYYE